VVGFTVRDRRRRAIQPLRQFAESWVTESLTADDPIPTALLFGRERDGLLNEELDACTDLVWIPSHPQHPSYNLAQAVLLTGYELFLARMAQDADMPRVRPRQTRTPPPAQLATAEELDDLFRHLRAAFLGIGYAYPHTADQLVRSYHEIFARARLYRREVKMMRGLARQILWAADQIELETDDEISTEPPKTDDETAE
jgi:TrmH family RNA methyltransferase